MPALEALVPRFAAAHTQPLGVSVDSRYAHANWAQSLGGVSFPLLADFHPKGAMAQAYGCYLDPAGITDRATVIVDADGIVRYAESVGPGGERNIAALAAEAEAVDLAYGKSLPTASAGSGLPAGVELYVRNQCGFSRAALLARDNLRLSGVRVRNVNDDPQALAALKAATGKEQAPCLIVGGSPTLETDRIVRTMVEAVTGFWS